MNRELYCCTLEMCGNQFNIYLVKQHHQHQTQSEENLWSSFFLFTFCQSLRQGAMLCTASCNKCLHFKFLMCFSDRLMLYLGYRSLSSYSILFHFTYKSAAEHEARIHSKRRRLLSGLQSNVEKILFWQDSHLWKRKRDIYLKMHIIKKNT